MKLKDLKEKAIKTPEVLTRDEIVKIASYMNTKESICSDHGKVVRKGDSMYCEKCDTDLGWFCEDSPDKICHYFTTNYNDTQVEVDLTNGSTYIFSEKYYDPISETEDSCLFCGQPKERK